MELHHFYDRLFFAREATLDEFQGYGEALCDIQADIEEALDEIDSIHADVASGEFVRWDHRDR